MISRSEANKLFNDITNGLPTARTIHMFAETIWKLAQGLEQAKQGNFVDCPDLKKDKQLIERGL